MRILRPDLDAEPAMRRELYALFETLWPRMSVRMGLAERAGAEPWQRVSTAFVAVDDGRIVAHVGVLAIPLMLAGKAVTVGGIHAVGTHPDYRRRGYVRRLLEEALAYCDRRFETQQLTTEVPGVFRGAGFRVMPQTKFELAPVPLRQSRFRPLYSESAADRELLSRLLRRRAPTSLRLASRDPGWLFIFDEVLPTGGFTRLHYADHLDLVAAYEIRDGRLRLYDLVAETLPPLDEVLAGIPGEYTRVDCFFTPDRFDVAILDRAEAYPGDNLMVRGPYPVEGEPVVLSPLAHC